MARPLPSQTNTSSRHLQSHSLPVSVQSHRIASAAAQSQNPALRDLREPLVLLLRHGRISFLCNTRLRCAQLTPKHPCFSIRIHHRPNLEAVYLLWLPPRADSGEKHPLFSARHTMCCAGHCPPTCQSPRRRQKGGEGRQEKRR